MQDEKNDAVVIVRTKANPVFKIHNIDLENSSEYRYRVCYIRDYEQYRFFEEKDPVNFGAYLSYAFGGSEVFTSKKSAMLQALKLKDKFEPKHEIICNEYNIIFFDEYFAHKGSFINVRYAKKVQELLEQQQQERKEQE